MQNSFSQFEFQNLNSIDVTLVLESPIGTQVVKTTVAANTTYRSNPNVNASTAKISVTAQGHDDYPDTETINLTGTPYQALISTLTAQSSIGSIHGVVTVGF